MVSGDTVVAAFLNTDYRLWLTQTAISLSAATLETPGIKAKGIEHQIARPNVNSLSAKPTRYQPAPCAPPDSKRRRMWT